jgi:hypothetical protein
MADQWTAIADTMLRTFGGARGKSFLLRKPRHEKELPNSNLKAADEIAAAVERERARRLDDE